MTHALFYKSSEVIQYQYVWNRPKRTLQLSNLILQYLNWCAHHHLNSKKTITYGSNDVKHGAMHLKNVLIVHKIYELMNGNI